MTNVSATALISQNPKATSHPQQKLAKTAATKSKTLELQSAPQGEQANRMGLQKYRLFFGLAKGKSLLLFLQQ